jgi:hypothetical protein
MSYIGNQPSNTAYLIDTFSGNGSTTTFTMQIAPAGPNSLFVIVSGVVQSPLTYSTVGNQLIFSQAPPPGTGNVVCRYLALPASNVTTTAYRNYTELTASANQTTFSVSSYTPGFIDVYRNGIKLNNSSYTATNGTTVVLGTAANLGDSIVVISFFVSGVLNGIPAIAGSVSNTNLATGAVTSSTIGAGAVAQIALDQANTNGTGAMILPAGTTGQRPSVPIAGQLRFNVTTGYPEIYSQGSWNSFATVANGLTSATPFVKLSDMSNASVNGTYWIKSASMSTPQQYYVDYTNTSGGPWIRIFLASTDNYNQTSYSWDNAASSQLLLDCQLFMYAFVNSSNNSLTYPWSFRFTNQTGSTFSTITDSNASAFMSAPPMGHGGSGAPLITAINSTRLADLTTYNGYYLRTGISSFGSTCDQGRSGVWGQICLKSLGSADTSGGGLSDFPHFTSFAYSGTDNWAASNQGYTTNSSDSAHRFGIYCKLS